MTTYVTFGQKYKTEPHPAGGHPDGWFEFVFVDGLAEETVRDITNELMHKLCGDKWCSVYHDEFLEDASMYSKGCLRRFNIFIVAHECNQSSTQSLSGSISVSSLSQQPSPPGGSSSLPTDAAPECSAGTTITEDELRRARIIALFGEVAPSGVNGSNPSCAASDISGYICTCGAGHKGPRASYGWNELLPYTVWDDKTHLHVSLAKITQLSPAVPPNS